MPKLGRHHMSHRRLLALLFAAATASHSGSVSAAEQSPSELQLQPPSNSTLEIRVARRPWLLEKLNPKTPEPSIKMSPPTPPALQAIPDPPSISTKVTERAGSSSDSWVPRFNGETATPDASPQAEDAPPARDEQGLGSLIQLLPLHSDATPLPLDEDSEQQMVPPVNVAPIPESSLDRQPAPSKDSSGDSDQVEAGPIAPPTGSSSEAAGMNLHVSVPDKSAVATPGSNAHSDRPGGLKESADDDLIVRDLQIDRDGSPRPETKPTQDSNPQKNSQTTPRGTSQFVGTDRDGIANTVQLDYAGYPAKPFRISSTVARMQPAMQRVLLYYHNRPETANERSNWGMLHSIMVYGVDTRILVGRRSYSAIAWIAGNNACRGQKLLAEGPRGIVTKSGVGLQGHQAQLLAVFALCDVPVDYPVYADEKQFAIRDIVEAEMVACETGKELTFTLIGLAHYLDTEAVWIGADGRRWDFERLIREELSQPIVGAACGGTHRLMGFAHALRKRRAEGRPITGQWKRAEMFSNDFVRYTYQLQNRDGSMSTDWFEGREDNGNLDRKIQTTGHIVEWLLTLTPDSQLQNPRLVRAVQFLLNSMRNDPEYDWKIGPKGHALRSLAMYYERVYRRGPAWKPQSMANADATTQR